MRFIRKRNLQEGEELLYVPSLHWIYPVRHIILALPFFLALLLVWGFAVSPASLVDEGWRAIGVRYARLVIENVFLAAFLVVLLVFVWRLFLYMSAEYGVTNKRLIMKRGIVRVAVSEIPTDRIESLHCIQGILGRVFDYGTLHIYGIGGMKPVFYLVSRPYALRRKIVEIIEKNKTITVVHGYLPKPIPAPVIKEDPIYRYGTFVRVLPGNEA